MSETPDETASTDTSEDTSSTEELDQGGPGDVADADLPEDLRPTEDNPLARHPEQTGDQDDAIGADREEDPETAPLTAADADYGSGGSDGSSGSGSSGGDGTADGRATAEEDDGSDTLDNGGGGAG